MATKGIKAVDVDGITVKVDTGYTQSWAGVFKAGQMSSTQRTEEERGIAAFEYYERAIANMDEVTDQLGDKPASEVMDVLSRALSEAQPKN